MGDGRVLAENSGLPAELAATLEPQVQHALDHRLRRRIMRILHSRPDPFIVTELHDRLPNVSRGRLSYHVRVLRDSGCLVEVGTRPTPMGRELELSSSLWGDDDALWVLEVTEASDLKSVALRSEREQ